jgi:hypothetical protein
MPEPSDLIIPMLPEMRRQIAEGFKQNRASFAALEARLGGLEKRQDSFRSALTADSLLSKLVTGEFEDRIVTLERRVQELESHK